MLSRSLLTVGLVALALLGCGGDESTSSNNGGGSGSVVVPTGIYGATESELYDPLRHASGIVVGPGSGLVTLQREPPAGPAAPLVGDTATVGVDEVWFDVTTAGTATLVLTEANLTLVARLEVLDSGGKSLLSADAAQRQSAGTLVPGRYRLRVVAAPLGAYATAVWAWFGGTWPQANYDDLVRLGLGNCVNCNLAGTDLTEYKLRGINLAGADMRYALLTSVPGGFSRSGANLLTIYIGGVAGSAIGGIDLSGTNLAAARLDGALMTGPGNGAANLSGANLSRASMTDTYLAGANLSGANLSGANLSRSVLTRAVLLNANLSGTDLTGAVLDGATWTDGQTCAPGSIGVCR